MHDRGSGTPGLYLIDTATGAATFQRPIVDGVGSPPSGGVVALHFSCAGVLYGGTARATDDEGDGGRLALLTGAGARTICRRRTAVEPGSRTA